MRTLTVLVTVATLATLAGATGASAQDRPHAFAEPAELICLDTLDAMLTAPLARMLVRGSAIVEADHQTNCLVVIGVIDTAPIRRMVAALEERARTRPPAAYPPSGGDPARTPARRGGHRRRDRLVPAR